MSTSISTDPLRLLPAESTTRRIAASLLERVEDLPIISPHGHVPAETIAENNRFPDPATMIVTPDHYVTRLLHASGVPLDALGVGGSGAEPREVWRRLCSNWHLFDGTASGYWLGRELADVFGVTEPLSAATADATFESIDALLASDPFRPRALLERFNIEVLATTDDPLDSLDAHRAIAADPTIGTRVLPTFRPDAYLKAGLPGWADSVERLIDTAGGGAAGYAGYLAALEARRAHFVASGAVSADHGALTPRTVKLDAADAERLFEAARAGTLDAAGAELFEAHMMYESARMSVDDGLVMTIHPGVLRNHHPATTAAFGPDSGHDIPFGIDYTRALQPLLADFGTAPGFHLVLFTIDETTMSREIAPLAGFYPSVFIGAPWWFLDAPDAIARFRSAVTETAGFSRGSGFIDDTRAFASIPARHDAARRVDAGYLARLVVERRITEERAAEIIVDIVDAAPRRVFKL